MAVDIHLGLFTIQIMQELDPSEALKQAVKKVLDSESSRRLVVAGPGAGKTFLFGQILEQTAGDEHSRIALTFINELKNDLEKSLSELAHVFTFHGYCYYLLRLQSEIRGNLSDSFEYFPSLADLIIRDWKLTQKKPVPKFIGMMRNLATGTETNFYTGRSDYYDAVSYDDSVYRTFEYLREDPDAINAYDLVLVDEYQDFNRLESSFIELLASKSSIVIAGDDDQALYSQLRSSSQKFIRNLCLGGTYEVFELPFCMRCPDAVIRAVNAIIGEVEKRGYLKNRIKKPFRYFPPVKGADSKKYPQIQVAECSVQMLKANYFGKYIAQEISKIPETEIMESHEKVFPTVLIIGSVQYLRQIQAHLEEQGYAVEVKSVSKTTLSREDGLKRLKANPESNLGWRIILEIDRPVCERSVVIESVKTGAPIHALLPDELKEKILGEATAFEVEQDAVSPEVPQPDKTKPTVKLTSFEGSKGLSAQHVFVVGVHENELPRNANAIQDLEICKFLVALTRTRKQCHLLITYRFSGVAKRPSILLRWIPSAIKNVQRVNKEFWT
jgi:superfamily I DNA/RNA helicase